MKKALITGITGQDGSYLAEHLLAKGYEVHGIVRRASSLNTQRIDHIFEKLTLHRGDVTDYGSIRLALRECQPDYVYNLAAQSQVRDSFIINQSTSQINFNGAINVMEAVLETCPTAFMYQASTSEMFGNTGEHDSNGNLKPINEDTALRPISPYGIAKTAAHHSAEIYKQRGLNISCGILFNHESERRGDTFVTQKIAKAVAEFSVSNRKEPLQLGNLSGKRDWGYAPDYMNAAVLMTEDEFADNYVIATGEVWSVEDFLLRAFRYAGLGDWDDYVEINERLKRPNELWTLIGDNSKARKNLGWSPAVEFPELVERMVDHQINVLYNKR